MTSIPLFRTEDALPAELGGLAYVGCDLYDDQRLGTKLRYGDGATKADAYLYDLGLASIPSDIRSGVVTEFFQQACGEVLALADQGKYLDLETRASQYLHLPDDAPDPMYLWAAFRYRQAPGPFVVDDGFRFSHVFLRTDSGYINKVRYTYPEHIAASVGADMIRFLLAWHEAVQGA